MWTVLGKHRKATTSTEVFHLMRGFGVDIQALAYHCHELGIFKTTILRQLQVSFAPLAGSGPPWR